MITSSNNGLTGSMVAPSVRNEMPIDSSQDVENVKCEIGLQLMAPGRNDTLITAE